ncbi:hypothetical protein HDU67_008531 [Dinochytrium kinnereticum]|nr:hypothetical protein HDU67_008531 [Dinochytrium kinnereticum]
MEDIFESSLGLMFDEPTFAHGDPGGSFDHTISTPFRSKFRSNPPNPRASSGSRVNDNSFQRGTTASTIASSNYDWNVRLLLPDVEAVNSPLMAHYVWQASLILSKRISSGDIDVQDSLVIEVGAGAGLLGVTAGLCGAQGVVFTDFPDPDILRCLDVNAAGALGDQHRRLKSDASGRDEKSVFWEVIGHKWGESTSLSMFLEPIKQSSKVVVFLADVLWNPTGHDTLLNDLKTWLAHPSSIAHVAAGLHTGRRTVELFVEKATRSGLFTCTKLGEVRVGTAQGEYQFFASSSHGGDQEIGDGDEENEEDEEKDPTERKRWTSRPPPGGHSSIIFGDDISSSAMQEPSPAASPKPKHAIISHNGMTSPMPATRTGRRMAPNAHQSRTSLIFGSPQDDAASSVGSDDGSDVGSLPRNVQKAFDGAAGISSPKQSPRRPEKRHLAANAQRSSLVFGDDGRENGVAVPSPPARSKSPSILPYEDSPSPRSGRRKPEGVAPNFKSNFSLSHRVQDSEAAAATSPASSPLSRRRNFAPGLKSSVILGDDSPPEPNFGPKKMNKVTGRRVITPPGGSSTLSFAEFTGALPEVDSSKDRDMVGSKVDPAAMSAAGRTTGKHRIY